MLLFGNKFPRSNFGVLWSVGRQALQLINNRMEINELI